MSEWWTYGLADFLLFSPATYYRLFALYNHALWPVPLAALAAGGLLIALGRRGGSGDTRAGLALLALAWLWVAYGYLHLRYARINWAADSYAPAFVLQALLLAIVALRLQPRQPPIRGVRHVGLGMTVAAVLLMPCFAPLSGRPWAQAEIFGLAPDPTVLATLGLLLQAPLRRLHLAVLLPVPLVWCAISGATLWTMRSPVAAWLPLAAAIALAAAVWPARPHSTPRRAH